MYYGFCNKQKNDAYDLLVYNIRIKVIAATISIQKEACIC